MGMYGLLCTISPKRRALLDEDPELVHDIIGARRDRDFPGMLHLGKAWDALDLVLNNGRNGTGVLGDAVLGRSGREIGPDMGFGKARLLDRARVAEIAAALAALPQDLVAQRFELVVKLGAHGAYRRDEDGAREALADELERLRLHYATAAGDGHGMLLAVV